MPMMAKLKKKFFLWLKVSTSPSIRLYDGYGDMHSIKIFGHVLQISPLPQQNISRSFLNNILSLLRLFIVKPLPRASVLLTLGSERYTTESDHNGFFQFLFKPVKQLEAGWHTAKVFYSDGFAEVSSEARVFIPHEYQYAFISDIDDTFLISHSANLRKRLYVLLMKNVQGRKPFDDVAVHYNLLAKAGATTEIPNPFFFVSSSEWNLYDYIREFCHIHKMPDGILLLSHLKRLKDFWKTGQGKHLAKYVRIARILESFPDQQYILLGDDSQQDPEIYAAAVRDFPNKIYAVYLRRVLKVKEDTTKQHLIKMETAGVFCCYFSHSAEAISHSKKIGLIK